MPPWEARTIWSRLCGDGEGTKDEGMEVEVHQPLHSLPRPILTLFGRSISSTGTLLLGQNAHHDFFCVCRKKTSDSPNICIFYCSTQQTYCTHFCKVLDKMQGLWPQPSRRDSVFICQYNVKVKCAVFGIKQSPVWIPDLPFTSLVSLGIHFLPSIL